MYCNNCGNNLNDCAKFCGRCGTPVTEQSQCADSSASSAAPTSSNEVSRPAESGDSQVPNCQPVVDAGDPQAPHRPPIVASGIPNQPAQGAVAPQGAAAAPKRANTKLIIAITAVVVVVICAVMILFATGVLGQGSRHSVALAGVSGPGYDANDSRVPVQVAGQRSDGSSFDEQQYVGPDGIGLNLPEGEYTLTVLASPLTNDGTFYQATTDKYEISVKVSQSGASGDISVDVHIVLIAKDPQEVTDDDIAATVSYARSDEKFDQDNVETYEEQAREQVHNSPAVRKSAYAQVCSSLISEYGLPQLWTMSKYESYMSGLCYADLLDMDGDGSDELVVIVDEEKMAAKSKVTTMHYTLKVYSCVNGVAQETHSGDYVGMEGTNGWLPAMSLYARRDGGYAVQKQGCNGSSPTSFTYTLYGFKAGESELAMRSQRGSTKSWTYYSDAYQTVVSEEQYRQLFGNILVDQDNPTQHIRMYQFSSSASNSGTLSLDVVKQTLSELGLAN